MAWTVEAGRKLRGKAKVFTSVFGLRTPSIAAVLTGHPFATELGKRGCDEYLLVDGRGKARARVWARPDGRDAVVQDPDPGPPIRKEGRMITGGPRTLGWLRDGAFRPVGVTKPPPELATALKAIARLGKTGPTSKPEKLKARWTRRVPEDLDALDALEKKQLAASARGLGAASVAKLIARLRAEDVDVERVVLTGTRALAGWVQGREDGVFFDADGTRPNGIAMSQGRVHDEKKDRTELVAAIQRALGSRRR